MSKFLKRKVHTVFLMLGNNCNMNCKYCLQHPLVTRQLTNKVNPEIYDFLKECAEELGVNQKLHIQFYGGEPLLYFETIKEVVKHTKDYCWFSVITNGKAVTKEMVTFFNTYNMPVTISWDGPNVLETRGYDVFGAEEKRKLLLDIEQLGLSAVLSSKAYPLEILAAFQSISDEYYKIHGYQVNINIDEIFNTGDLPEELLSLDYSRVEQEMLELGKYYLETRIGGRKTKLSDYTKLCYIDRFFGTLKRFYVEGNGKFNRSYCSCGNGYDVLNLDLEGNLYPCHNTSHQIGKISDEYFSYLNKVLAVDNTKLYKVKCDKCPAVAFCRGGCKLISSKNRAEGYCRLKQAVFLPIVSVFEEYGRQMAGEANGG